MGVRRRRIGFAVGAGAMALGAAALALAAVSLSTASPSAAPPESHHATTSSTTTTTTTLPPSPDAAALASATIPASTLVATTNGSVAGYASPDAPAPSMTVPGTWYGYPSVLPVISTEPGWLYVRLAQRPNGSTIWVHQSDVTLSSTPYAIVLSLTTEHLYVFEDGSQIFEFPAGIGAPDDPTPTGEYFIPMQYPSPGPGYGPFVLVTSDHSDTITDWENSGDAIIGIHGPITSYDDSLIGATGAAISHGCIRLHDADLAQLSVIPAGTPLDIVS
jgi:lipoprotein-anchoring transpeptidase ErfK/SrfK